MSHARPGGPIVIDGDVFEARMLRLEAKIQRAEIVHTGPELVLRHHGLRSPT